ncbi:hypothetical protein LSAT2_004341 [Lamellibrachia satsuma]|nr:hypothetical protein LSAT2_004341 [Lamellibrachia satsuma]
MSPHTDKLIEELVKALLDLGLNDVVEIVKQDQLRHAEDVRKERLKTKAAEDEVRRLQEVLNTKVRLQLY